MNKIGNLLAAGIGKVKYVIYSLFLLLCKYERRLELWKLYKACVCCFFCLKIWVQLSQNESLMYAVYFLCFSVCVWFFFFNLNEMYWILSLCWRLGHRCHAVLVFFKMIPFAMLRPFQQNGICHQFGTTQFIITV